MGKPKRKHVLIALLKGLIAGAETSALGKSVTTFIAELASMSEDKEEALEALAEEQFNELLTQSELAMINDASAAAEGKKIKDDTEEIREDTTRIKEDVNKLIAKLDELLSAAINKDERVFHNLRYSSIGNLFKGRGEDFEKLKAALGDKSQTTAITQERKDRPEAIHGLGGIGKTRLAVGVG